MLINVAGDWVPVPGMRETPSRLVWHYTDARGLLGILSDGELWASAPLTLNDSTEVAYGIDLVASVWEEIRDDLADQGATQDSLALLDRLTGPDAGLWSEAPIYVVCASSDGDALNQWQGYARSIGYAVALDPLVTLLPLAEPIERSVQPGEIFTGSRLSSGWYDVIYDPDEQRTITTELLTFAVTKWASVGTMPAEAGIGIALTTLVARLKHPGFASEKEVRFVTSRPPEVKERFREGARGITPYVVIKAPIDRLKPLSADPDKTAPLPVRNVRLAPCGEHDRAPLSEAARRLLDSRGFEAVAVSSSEIPYRF